MKKKINKYDILLIAVIIILNMSLLLLSGKELSNSGNNIAYVYSNNELVGEYILSDGYEKVFTVRADAGFNTIKIKDKSIWIEDADCPDKYCEKQGKISKDGEVIVCLPHKLVIKVVGNNNSDIDIITK